MTGGSYSYAHRRARRLLDTACARCGATTWLQAALRPETPADRLLIDLESGCRYSTAVELDYFTLCLPCHRHLDLVEGRPECGNGHPYTPATTRLRPDGTRRCLVCHREAEARRLADPAARDRKNALERANRKPPTPAQHERRMELQRIRRAGGRR